MEFKTFPDVTFPIAFNKILSVSTLSMISDIGDTTYTGSTIIPSIEHLKLTGTEVWGCKNNSTDGSKCYCQTLFVIGY